MRVTFSGITRVSASSMTPLLLVRLVAGFASWVPVLMVMGPAGSLPPGVSATRLPDQLLPNVLPAQHALFRPDLLLIPNWPHGGVRVSCSATTPSRDRALSRSIALPPATRCRTASSSRASSGAARQRAPLAAPAPTSASLPLCPSRGLPLRSAQSTSSNSVYTIIPTISSTIPLFVSARCFGCHCCWMQSPDSYPSSWFRWHRSPACLAFSHYGCGCLFPC